MLKDKRFLPQLPFYLILGCVFGFALWSLYTPIFFNNEKVQKVLAAKGDQGDPYTVCDTGCDYTDIAAALGDIADDKYVEIQSPHSNSVSSTQNWSGDAKGSYISCASSDIIFATGSTDYDIELAATTTIDGCTISQANITSGGSAITITNNTFTTDTLHTIVNNVTTTDWTVTGNTGLMFLDLSGGGSSNLNGCSDCTISSNAFHIVSSTTNGLTFSGTNVQVANNTITVYDSEHEGTLVTMSTTTNSSFVTNTIEYAVSSITTAHYPMFFGGSGNDVKSATNLQIRGNFIYVPDQESSSYICNLYSTSTANFSAVIQDNTFVTKGTNSILAFNLFGSASQAVSSSYNIFYSASSTAASGNGYEFVNGITTTTLTYYSDYNGFYNLSTKMSDQFGESFDVMSGSNSLNTDPFFANTSTYATLEDYSPYLDVNGALDIGHMSQTRDGTFLVGADRNIKQFDTVSTSLRANDTVTFDAGTFDDFVLSTSNVTVSGQGATTIITADTNQNAVELSSADSCTLQDMVIQNASSTVGLYTAVWHAYSYNSNNYNQNHISGNGHYIIFQDDEDGLYVVNSAADDVSDYVGTTPQDFDLALLDATTDLGMRFAVYHRNDLHTTLAEGEDFWQNTVELPNSSIDCWVDDVLVYNSATGEYDYTAPTGCAAGDPAVIQYEGADPDIYVANSYVAGIKLTDSDSNTIQNVTSTASGYGVWFEGTSASNSINSSTISSSNQYDIFSSSTADNLLKNTSFTPASSTINLAGEVDVYFKARAYVTSATSSAALSGITVTLRRADEGDETDLTSAADGYTPFSDFLLSFTMTSSSIATNNGGYNPWDVLTTATDDYGAYGGTNTIDTQDETISIELSAATSVPTAPSSFATTSVSTSSIAFSWTDNSSGSEQEDNFILDYITGSDTGDFPGTTSTPAQDATTATVSSLSPNTQYTFRLAADNSAGTSSYTTSSAMYTNPVTPGTPSVSSGGQDTLVIAWSANSNGSGTTYEVYNVTTDASAGTTTNTSLTVAGLSAGTSYQFKVRARYLSDGISYTSYSSNSSAVSTDAATSGGSSGSSIPAPIPPAPSVEAPATIDFSIETGRPKTILIGNTVHTFTTQLSSNGTVVVITIESDPIVIELREGEEELVDTDRDGENDLFIRANSITRSSVDLTISAIDDLEFSINKALSITDDREVVLYLNSPNTVMMAVSNSDSFSGVSYESYSNTKEWALTPGNGEKTVYVKLRTEKGGEKIISDTITLTGQPTEGPGDYDGCVLEPGMAYKNPDSPAVYYITESCTKRLIKSEKKFFSYFDSWDEVSITDQETLNSVSDDDVGFMPWGPNYDPKYGALVKIISDPKVYLLLETEKYLIGSKQWITSEMIFETLGYAWNWIEDVSESLLVKYTDGPEIDYTDHHPNYTLIKYQDNPKVYRLEPASSAGRPDLSADAQVKRWVVDELTFESLGFRWDRIVTIAESEEYEEGEELKIEPEESVEGIKIDSSNYQFINFLSRGMVGDEIKKLQIKLLDLGFFPEDIEPNGVFGPVTEQAVKDFQSANGIDPVGYLGPMTRETINSL